MAVVALQIGNYSNTVGAYWWNMHRSWVNNKSEKNNSEAFSSSLFRESDCSRKGLHNPRLIAVDLKTNLSVCTALSGIVEEKDDSLLWSGKRTEIHQDEMSCERRWSDILVEPLTPKSLLPVSTATAKDSLQCFATGLDVARERQFVESLEDKLHYFVEECDVLQGFHLLTDFHNGFGGVSSSILELLSDEYGAEKSLVCGCYPPALEHDLTPPTALLNSILSISHITLSSGLFLPLSTSQTLWPLPSEHVQSTYLTFEPTQPHHSGGILSTAIDTFTTGYEETHLFQEIISRFSVFGRKIASLSCSLPLPLVRGSSLAGSLNHSYWSRPLMLTPYFSQGEIWKQYCVVRGVPSSYIIE
jgi:hypothetical protein